MTRTSFENKISLGTVIQIGSMLAFMAAGYADLRTGQGHQAEALAKAVSQIEASETRIRAIEQASAVTSARYESLSQTMGEVKAELRQTNELLRRVLEGPAR